jgi:formate hydrogenlyase transcriptional activator
MEYFGGTENLQIWGQSSVGRESPASPELLHKFFDAPNIGFAILDSQLRYVAINHTLASLNGLPVEAHLGRTVRDILGDFADKVDPLMRQVLLSGEPLSFEVDVKAPGRESSGHWIDCFFPIRDVRENVQQVGVMVLEVDQEKVATAPGAESFSRVQRLEALLDFGTLLMSSFDENDLLPAISDFLRRLIGPDFASLALYEESSRRLCTHPLKSPLSQELAATETDVPADDPPYGPTFLHGEVRVHNCDSLLGSDVAFLRQLMTAGIQSVIFLPLISRNGTLGTLNLGRKEDNAFTSDDVAFLRQVAAHIALALDNASAYREIRNLTEKLNKEKLYLEDEVRSAHDFEEIVGESPALKRVLGQVHTVAPSDATVLILGETGTGKELIARAIHRLSARKDANFIKLNCAAIPTGLLESELFGHEKGAFTGAISQKIGRLELADKGTLFLDEVGEIPLELQPKLLRVLQDQEFERLGSTRTIKVDIRLIAATNRDLAKSVSAHEFRSDLFYRLNVFPVRLPALRERGRDVPLLVRHFVQKFAKRMNKPIDMIPAEAMRALQSWAWPGNVRELENFMERSVILSLGSTLSVPLAELRAEIESPEHDTTLENLERQHILRVLRETGGVIAGMHGAAARLGMKRTTLQSRMLKLGISREEYQN